MVVGYLRPLAASLIRSGEHERHRGIDCLNCRSGCPYSRMPRYFYNRYPLRGYCLSHARNSFHWSSLEHQDKNRRRSNTFREVHGVEGHISLPGQVDFWVVACFFFGSNANEPINLPDTLPKPKIQGIALSYRTSSGLLRIGDIDKYLANGRRNGVGISDSPNKTLALTKTQNINWLEAIPSGGVYFRYFRPMLAVSTAASWHVSALQKLGSLTISLQSGGG